MTIMTYIQLSTNKDHSSRITLGAANVEILFHYSQCQLLNTSKISFLSF